MNDDLRRVRGGPAWVYSDRYTINDETSDRAAAGPTGGPTPDTSLLGPMPRLLLEDRFQLKTHRDTEEVGMYSLTVAKGGLKIKPMEEGDCVPFDPPKTSHGILLQSRNLGASKVWASLDPIGPLTEPVKR
jgi:uncharacterized protein (TIGR03435 family)